jgi:hypothetical protein
MVKLKHGTHFVLLARPTQRTASSFLRSQPQQHFSVEASIIDESARIKSFYIVDFYVLEV